MSQKTPEELLKISYDPGPRDWMDPHIDFEKRRGTWSYPGAAKNLKYMGFANPREWSPTDADWKLPENWKQIIRDGLKDRLKRYRSLQVFLDTCVRCGACADKCHFFIGSGDPKNMPVLRAELLRSVYRNDFTTAGKILGRLAGGRPLTKEVRYFVFFNLAAFPLVWGTAVVLAEQVLPALGLQWHVREIAHGIAIALPLVVNYYLHKFITFRPGAA